MDERRDLTGDVAAMRALAHPVRLAVLELLGRDGPLTATQAGRHLAQKPGNMSWHLRILARHGFVVEAPGGRGRSRPWTLTALGHRIEADPGSDEERLAADELLATVADRGFGQLRAWLAARHSAPQAWRRAAVLSDWTLHLTAQETAELRERVHALFETFGDRLRDPGRRPPGAEPVKAMLVLHPLRLPPAP
ncbi:helix-turn-helix domain-containing protein [Dactylosporangium roseum]|uniref:Helix-turn-helix domain-containing protein n=1 Tax=Dactylosporangium roseum TaxID=47989 RepID=A0ABY5YVZ2_9ACTN|nr:helix-turn-helix domain-containing protein [Dactylosporangium roseum]UWZ33910.1 helix-turn-helix domain-containing protein [Dactylosporangium roseum]